jgi:hypothetical protein
MGCELCEWKAANWRQRWNGPDRSHCNWCHADWRLSSNAMHCRGCHLTFGSPAACDEHEWPSGCQAPETVGLIGTVNKWGTVVFRLVREQGSR